jgi:uncharacterized caspase-like protein
MISCWARSILFFALLMAFGRPAYAEVRVALVIGISNYATLRPLANPVRDAALIASSLENDEFKVTRVSDPDAAGLRAALAAFQKQAADADAAVIYYAGHGVEFEGRNYLLPKDIAGSSRAEIEAKGVPALSAADALKGAKQLPLLILDACREDPFEGRGLSRAETIRPDLEFDSASRVVVLMAASKGKIASDGKGMENSPFAALLASAMQQKGMAIAMLPSAIAGSMKKMNLDQAPDQQGIWPNSNWSFKPGEAKTANTELMIGKPELIAQFGVTLRPNPAMSSSFMVADINYDSPLRGKLLAGDVIVSINGAAPDISRSSAEQFKEQIEARGRAQLLIQRGGATLTLVLRP